MRQDHVLLCKANRTSRKIASLDGEYLSLRNSQLGVFPGDTAFESAVKFYTMPSQEATGLVELHTYPVGIIDHTLALVGGQGLLSLKDVANPAATSFPTGTTCDWRSFSMQDTETLTYAGSSQSSGRWVAFPSGIGSWAVKWKDGECTSDRTHIPFFFFFFFCCSQPTGVGLLLTLML
jgi:hypothetical protein